MITPCSISIILHMIRKLNSIIVNYASKVSKKYYSCTQCTGGSHIISYCGEIAEGDLVSYFKFAVSLGNLGQLEIMKILSRSPSLSEVFSFIFEKFICNSGGDCL